MTICFNAFKNCNSLQEIHFEKCTEPVKTDIYNCGVPDSMKIIVHDKMYSQFLKTEHPSNHYRLTFYSDYIQQKIDKIKNSNIILSIIYLYNILQLDINNDILQSIKIICNILIEKYNISNITINYVKYLLNKKQEILDESRT